MFHLLAATCYILCRLPPCDCNRGIHVFLSSRGGVRLRKDVRRSRGVKGKAEKCGQGGEGVQNPENFADVLYVWSPRYFVCESAAPSSLKGKVKNVAEGFRRVPLVGEERRRRREAEKKDGRRVEKWHAETTREGGGNCKYPLDEVVLDIQTSA